MIREILSIVFIFSCLSIFFSCKKEKDQVIPVETVPGTNEPVDSGKIIIIPPVEIIPPPAIPDVFVSPTLKSFEKIGSFTPQQIVEDLGSYSQANHYVKHPIEVYKLIYYTTDANNQKIEASGAIVVPMVDSEVPMLSLQHGTITSQSNAPSNYQDGSEVRGFGAVLGSYGYFIVAPDYIGYGVSQNLKHPYEHAATLARSGFDMIIAAKEFCKQKNIPVNEKLFLGGYSEGGNATMSIHKFIEENHPEITVTASAPGAGAYNKLDFAKYILSTNQPLQFIQSYLWVLETYDSVYRLDRGVSYYINEPYATLIEQYGREAEVEKNPTLLFTKTFRDGILNGTDTEMINILKENSIDDWRPTAPIALFHGTEDDFVPYSNSSNAFAAMRARGAPNVTLYPLYGADHFSGVAGYSLGIVQFFQTYY